MAPGAVLGRVDVGIDTIARRAHAETVEPVLYENGAQSHRRRGPEPLGDAAGERLEVHMRFVAVRADTRSGLGVGQDRVESVGGDISVLRLEDGAEAFAKPSDLLEVGLGRGVWVAIDAVPLVLVRGEEGGESFRSDSSSLLSTRFIVLDEVDGHRHGLVVVMREIHLTPYRVSCMV